ncbi:Bax inhibitor-1/YccA family protein [Nonomuraea gerenzanensis]|uniref:PROBABLE CONSERVED TRANSMEMBRANE PROTEIN n=1 Tax=Nonomuraea gerenzanensis TaxID=93944 RepID=A0A1M4EQ47_9ACTN|nr:Bax inhibitor-1/YccA family protein [Nonomuraea gerenzanensis]UBU12397.1 Bax inhibitor-1/YccA family protein [Nonomuraea gerenzanensis]SBP00947.1 PROBABLE CONSERVED TRANSMEMBRANE PROTEIN [Nonomuraea gerenzanensis]
MESKNPVFSRSRQQAAAGWAGPTPSPDQLQNMYDAPSYAPPSRPAYRTMTLDDVVVRGFMTLGALVLAAAAAWYFNVPPMVAIGAAIVALVLGLIASFTMSTNPALILGYAVAEGVFLGKISSVFEGMVSGIVMQAVLGTAFAFGAVLTVYALRIVRVTPKLVKFVIAAAIAAVGLMLVNLLVGLFNDGGLGLRTDTPLGWIFSIAMILLGCFFLLLDFDSIEQGVKQGAPAKFAWQCAFGLTLSLVWIYLEVLRFVSYFSSSD